MAKKELKKIADYIAENKADFWPTPKSNSSNIFNIIEQEELNQKNNPYVDFINAIKNESWDEVLKIVKQHPKTNFNKDLNFHTDDADVDPLDILNPFYVLGKDNFEIFIDLKSCSPLSFFILKKQESLIDLFLEQYPPKSILTKKKKSGRDEAGQSYPLLTFITMMDNQALLKKMEELTEYKISLKDMNKIYVQITEFMEYKKRHRVYPKNIVSYLLEDKDGRDVINKKKEPSLEYSILFHSALKNKDIQLIKEMILSHPKKMNDMFSYITSDSCPYTKEDLDLFKKSIVYYYEMHQESPKDEDQKPLLFNFLDRFNYYALQENLSVLTNDLLQYQEFVDETVQYMEDHLEKNQCKNDEEWIKIRSQEMLSFIKGYNLPLPSINGKPVNIIHEFMAKIYTSQQDYQAQKLSTLMFENMFNFCHACIHNGYGLLLNEKLPVDKIDKKITALDMMENLSEVGGDRMVARFKKLKIDFEKDTIGALVKNKVSNTSQTKPKHKQIL